LDCGRIVDLRRNKEMIIMLDLNEIPGITEEELKDIDGGECTVGVLCAGTPTPDFEFALLACVGFIRDWLNDLF